MPDGEAQPGTILCLHLGDKIGWCLDPSSVGVWTLPRALDHGGLGATLIDAVADICKAQQTKQRVTTIVLSGPPNEVETTDRPDVAVLHIGLLMAVRIYAYRRKIRMSVPNLFEVRERMLGRADIPKSALRSTVMGFARRRGLDKIDLDAAHALVLWTYATTKEGVK